MLWSRRTTFAVVPFDGKYPTSYLIAIVVFALSLSIYEIFANQEQEGPALMLAYGKMQYAINS